MRVAEVLSSSDPRHDRFTKRRRYQEARVPLYWIVGWPGAAGRGPDPEGAGAPFTLSLEELFRPIR